MMLTNQPPNPYLGIHVVGPGLGESIIVEIPGHAPGIIDCGNAITADFILEFFKERRQQELSFLAVTHPHADHIEGISKIIKEFNTKIKKLYLFQGFPLGPIMVKLCKYLKKIKGEEAYFCAARVVEEWVEIANLIQTYNLDVEYLQYGTSQTFNGNPALIIECLVPVSKVASDFQNSLSSIGAAIPEDPTAPTAIPRIPRPNLASSGLLLKWGNFTGILSSDVEIESWKELSKEDLPEGDVKFIKIGHHGSKTGHFDELYTKLSETSVCVITPFQQGKVRLPDDAVVQELKLISNHVAVTSGPEDPCRFPQKFYYRARIEGKEPFLSSLKQHQLDLFIYGASCTKSIYVIDPEIPEIIETQADFETIRARKG